MNPQNQQPLQQLAQEEIIFKIKRHPIGIIGVYVLSSIILIILAVVAFGIIPNYVASHGGRSIYAVTSLAYLIFLGMVLVFVYVSHLVYWDNSWTLSTESLAQVTRTSLFDKQSSHLSLGNLQDVTASQVGILQHLFHYGTLKVETAGEASRFVFTYCANPNSYAEYILEAREKFEQSNGLTNNGLKKFEPNLVETNEVTMPPLVPPDYPIPPAPPVDPSVD